MIPTLSPRSLRRLSTLVLALVVATVTSPLAFERHDSRRAVFGERSSAAAHTGVLAHAGSRGEVRTAALGRGAASASITVAHAFASVRSARAARVQRIAERIVGEHPVDRPRPPHVRPANAAPHQTRVATAAAPRAPPRG